MSLDDQLVAMSETQPWKFFALQGLNFQFLELNFQFLEGNFKMSEPCTIMRHFEQGRDEVATWRRHQMVGLQCIMSRPSPLAYAHPVPLQ